MFIEDGTVMATDEMMTSIKSAYGKDSSCMIVITKDALHDFLMDRVIILKRVSANKHQKMCEGNLSYVENNSGMYYITIDGTYVYGGEHMVVLPHISNTKKKRGAHKCASNRDRKRRSKGTTRRRRRRQLGGGCRRSATINDNCVELMCTDYENGHFNPIIKTECSGWAKYFDEEANATYYYNATLGEAKWEKPDEYEETIDEKNKLDIENYMNSKNKE